VPKPLREYLGVRAGSEQVRGVPVAQVVEPDTRKPCSLDYPSGISLGDVMSVERLAARLAENEVMDLVLSTHHALKLDLSRLDPPQFRHQSRGQGDSPPGSRGFRVPP
jgi:hypothetical protein